MKIEVDLGPVCDTGLVFSDFFTGCRGREQ